MSRILFGLMFFAWTCGLTGCQGETSKIAPVDGVILFNGLPARATITAQPVNDAGQMAGRPSISDTRTDGSFSLQYGDQKSGALLGAQQVTISVFPHERAEGEFGFNQRFQPVKFVKFTRKVVAGKNNHWKFYLTF
jgi:hypothetical protein